MKTLKLSTKPYIYNVDNVNVIKINLLYPVKIQSKNIDLYKLLLASRIIASSSKKYNKIDLFDKALNKNLIIKYSVNYVRFDKELFISVDYTIPKEGLIEEYNIEEAIKLLYECIYNPDVNANKFSGEIFDWNRDILLNDVMKKINNIYDLTVDETINSIDTNHKYFFSREDRIKLVQDTNASNVYEYYKKNVLNNKFVTFIYGKIEDEKRILEIFNKYFKQDYYEFNIKVHIYNFMPFKQYEDKVIYTRYNQSVISQVYQIENIKKEDSEILRMLYYFLSSRENDLLFNKLRNEYNLIY